MKHVHLAIFFVFGLMLGVGAANAQFISSGGPSGGSGGSAVFAFGDTAYIRANGYLMRTFDGGATWVQLTNGLGSWPYRVQPNCFGRIGNTIYMATQSANLVYRSTDFGDTWTQYQDGVTWGGIATNAVSSNGRVFMAGNGFLNLSYTTGDAAGWHATTVGGIATAISLIGTDSIWATLGGKTFYSHDNGDTWTQIAKEPLTGFGLGATDYIRAGGRILAVTNGGGGNTTYYSDDYGATWKLATKGFAGGRKLVKISDDEIYGVGYLKLSAMQTAISAVYRTTDRGEHWEPVAEIPNALTMTGWRNAKLLVSGDATYSVTPSDATALLMPFPHLTLTALVNDNTNLYAVAPTGLSVRPLSGGQWSVRSDLAAYFTGSINSFSLYGGKMYLATDKGAFMSTDLGQSFSLVSPYFDGSNMSGIYADDNVMMMAHLKKGVIPAFDATDSIFTSTNGGGSWSGTAINFTSTPGFQTRGFVKHNGKYYVYGTTGYAVSADNGGTWTFTNTTEFAYTIGTRLYSFDGTLYRERYDIGGTSTFHVDYSTNDGSSWVPDSAGFQLDVLSHPKINGVFLSNGTLYAYVNDPGKEGVAMKSKVADTWTMISGTGAVPSFPLAIIANGNDLFISVTGESMWTNQTTVGGVPTVTSTAGSSMRIYPNPARHSVMIQVPAGQKAGTVDLIDATGRVVAQYPARSGDGISLEGIRPGLYILRSGSAHGTVVVK